MEEFCVWWRIFFVESEMKPRKGGQTHPPQPEGCSGAGLGEAVPRPWEPISDFLRDLDRDAYSLKTRSSLVLQFFASSALFTWRYPGHPYPGMKPNQNLRSGMLRQGPQPFR